MRPSLSPGQYRLLVLMAQGLPLKDAARRHGVTYYTGRHILSAAYRRLGVDNKVSAFRVLGWLTPPAPDTADPERLDGWTRRELER